MPEYALPVLQTCNELGPRSQLSVMVSFNYALRAERRISNNYALSYFIPPLRTSGSPGIAAKTTVPACCPAPAQDRTAVSASALPATGRVHPVGAALRLPLSAVVLLRVYSANVALT